MYIDIDIDIDRERRREVEGWIYIYVYIYIYVDICSYCRVSMWSKLCLFLSQYLVQFFVLFSSFLKSFFFLQGE